MNNPSITPRKLLSAIVAVAAVVTANLVAKDVDSSAPVTDDAAPAEIMPAPAPITGIAAPVVEEILEFGAPELTVPVLRRPVVLPPPPPKPSRGALLGTGVLPAPDVNIRVEPPSVGIDATASEARIDVPALVRPELPAPPPVR